MRKYIITEKRHIKQMNKNERAYLDNVVRPIIKKDCDDSLPKLSYHSLQRFKQKFPKIYLGNAYMFITAIYIF